MPHSEEFRRTLWLSYHPISPDIRCGKYPTRICECLGQNTDTNETCKGNFSLNIFSVEKRALTLEMSSISPALAHEDAPCPCRLTWSKMPFLPPPAGLMTVSISLVEHLASGTILAYGDCSFWPIYTFAKLRSTPLLSRRCPP